MKKILNKKIIFVILPIVILLIATLIAIGITNAAGNTAAPETEQTFTEEGDGYYIWVRAVDHAGNKGPWSEAQRVWIDNKGPSAPVIQGGSTEYALSRTISVKTVSDDSGASGVAYYEYYKKSGSDKPAASVNGTKTTSTISQTFNTNIAGDYVFFRAVDVVGNKGAWSDGEQVYIDVNKPTVTCTATNSKITIKQGDNKTLSSYFTVTPTGTNKAYTTTYKIGSTAYANTSTLTVGTHIVTCTATITGGNSNIATMTVVVEKAGPAVDSIGLAKENTVIKPSASSNVQIVIPAGWAPAILEGSNSTTSLPGQSGKVKSIMPAEQWESITVDQINQGIVIVNGTSDFEEYVWIPMPESGNFARVAWQQTEFEWDDDEEDWYEYEVTQQLAETSTKNAYWEDKTTTEYKNMVSSVTKNKGFYIGRYEASQKSSTVAQSKRGKTTWTSITQTNAITYSTNSTISNCHLIHGIEWDSVLNWLIGRAVIEESMTMDIYDIEYDSSYWGNYEYSNGGASSNSGTVRTTGYSEYWKANNIYDLAGNVFELTQEKARFYGDTVYASRRGGNLDYNDYSAPAAFRASNLLASSGYDSSTRFPYKFFLMNFLPYGTAK